MDELLDIAPCGVLLFDDRGTILKTNATLTALLGYDQDDLESKSIETILSLASRVFYNTHFFPLLKLRSRADEIFLTLVSKEGKAVPVLSNAVCRNAAHGGEYLVIFMPVFERKKFEDEIIQARRAAEKALKENSELQRLTDTLESHARALEIQNRKILAVNEDLMQFNKIISHDLQEPIRKIRLFTGIVLESAEDSFSGRRRSSLEKIEKSAQRLTELTMALREYVKVDEEVERDMIDLNDCLSVAASRAQELRNFHDFRLHSERLPSIEGYKRQLAILFYHLFDNAIQFRDPARPLEITVAHTLLEENIYHAIPDRYRFVEHLRIVFSDNGIGFDNQFKDDVFFLGSKFHLGGTGMGMGLALIKKIVTNHGGAISIESAEGKGTDVILLLPLSHTKT